ncbi:MAG: copper chaperone PCu(A)C [Gammaproteobacteria bacterium]|jgi:copper(I)-binding protein|uniref:Transporter n=1 Tax=Pseudomonas fluorescens TaxID=294 RepID=A0A5E7KTR4_PSEFL|nr:MULTISPECIES: copper chaperone PCu(A)C [Pseudomonas]MBU0822731.1 copper chaperone PCu(A)C [Gammaproteobacteria bacterium]MBA4363197.1 transporter [Pseudomonas sp.]MBU0843103.1 copper chaperone PCu(A)C [Gammaproteobacteria bacterium]MDO8708245.1 copper chaperone PCu(A)C [Pseudomonas sp.]QZB00510.1 copper chaperone PCu(A)C [Pseudomonas mandelii]
MNSIHANTAFSRRVKQLVLGCALIGMAWQVSAQTRVDDAWVRATVAGQPSTGAFMTLQADSDSKLLSVQSPVAKTVQIHQSSMKDDVMSMRQVESVELPAGKPVNFDPHGYHVMLMDLTAQVKEGDKVPLILTVENAKGEKETIKVEAEARALGMADHSKMH